MNEIEVLKSKVELQTQYSFRLFIPFGLFIKSVNVFIKPVVEFFRSIGKIVNIPNIDTFFDRINNKIDNFDLFDLNLVCKSIDKIPELSYEYKSIKFLNTSFVQMVGRNYNNDISITFLCDNKFNVYEKICLWCDFVELISMLNFDILNDINFCSLLTLYKIDCKTPSKVFRFWGLRPKEKPSVGGFDRENIDSAIDLSVSFTFSYVERVL